MSTQNRRKNAQPRRPQKRPIAAGKRSGSRQVSQGKSKQDTVLSLLGRQSGSTIAVIAKSTGWQPHSVRGFFAGIVRKKLGLTLTSDKIDGQRVYRIVPPGKSKPEVKVGSEA